MLQRLWMNLVRLFKKSKDETSARGVFQYDEKLKKMVRVSDQPAEEGKYAMPLAEYLHRRNHVSKGSWKRPIDSRYARKEALQGDDFGRTGCKDGYGMFHPMEKGKCIYCGLNKRQILKRQKEHDNGLRG